MFSFVNFDVKFLNFVKENVHVLLTDIARRTRVTSQVSSIVGKDVVLLAKILPKLMGDVVTGLADLKGQKLAGRHG